MRTVLVVDDKEMMRDSVATTLQRAGFAVVTANDGRAGVEAVERKRPDVVVSDMRMPGGGGIELLEAVRRTDDELPVIMMTAFGDIKTAVEAMKLGAFDFLQKPFEGDALVIAVKRAIEHRRLLRENTILRASSGSVVTSPGRIGLDRLIGESPAMHSLKKEIGAVASSSGTVLITGESGVGKEVVARAVHELSPRRDGPFLAMNCAAMSPSLLESELFGHERGAFTGAERTRKGRFELADGGTLLLDEVSEIDPPLQAKLLRVLQEKSFERVGSSTSIGVDVRIIATSNRDLPASVDADKFRRDLYFRLSVLPLSVPALRARREDIPLLAEHFVREVCKRDGRETLRFEQGAIDLLAAYAWPGNVRELQNICERAVVLSPASGSSRAIAASLIEPWLRSVSSSSASAAPSIEAKPAAGQFSSVPHIQDPKSGIRKLDDIERQAIVETLDIFKGHRQRTAKSLGIGVRTLGLKLKKWKELRLISDNA